MFLLDNICDIARYADGNISYTSNVYEDLVINKTENFSGDPFKQFRENHLKANPDKCHLLKFYKYKFYKFEDNYINSCNEEKLFGMKIDSQLSFASHVSSFCNKANQKLHAKSRVTNYMDPDIPRCFTISFVT